MPLEPLPQSEYTGECDTIDPGLFHTHHHCCTAVHPEVCPTAQHLANIDSIGLWAEGVAGSFELIVQSIGVSL